MKQIRVLVLAASLLPLWACTTTQDDRDRWEKYWADQRRQEEASRAKWEQWVKDLRAWQEAEPGRIGAMMQGWVGHHQSELILAWGPYSDAKPDGNGGEVLIYVFGSRTRTFYVNDRGIIYSWRWEGQ